MKFLHFIIFISFLGIISLKTVSLIDCSYYFGKFCYNFYHESVTHSEAEERCRSRGGELAAVPNSDVAGVLQRLTSHYYGNYFWVASIRRTDQGIIFTDGTLLNITLMNGLQNLVTSNVERSCLHYGKQQLQVDNCQKRKYYICQFKGKNCHVSNDYLRSFSNDEACMQAFTIDQMMQPTEQIQITCKKGYVLEEESNLTCLADGSLAGMKHCVAGCYAPQISNYARIINSSNSFKKIYKVGDTIFVVCEKGFFGVGENVKTHIEAVCLSSGQWSVTDFNCTNIRPFRPVHNTLDEEPRMVTEGSSVLLSCPEDGLQKSWIKDQRHISQEHSEYEIQTNGKLKINNFSSHDVGLYTCITTEYKYSIHNLQLNRLCENSENNYLETTINESETLFLECNGTANASEIKWYKNNERFWGNEKVKIFRNGMVIFENIHWSDAGDYLCMVFDMVNKCSQNTTIKVQVKPKDKCGLIAGDAPLEGLSQLPWLAVLWWPLDFMPFCYGTLISDRWIVTTASCLFGSHRRKKPGFIVKLGKDTEDLENIDNITATSIIVTAGAVVIHPNYSRRLNHNDIGLVRLESAITLTNDHYPICLPLDPPLIDQNSCKHRTISIGYLCGYGPLDSRWEYNAIVESLQIAPQSDCQVASPLPSSMFCANSSQSSEFNDFAGDSGTPMQIKWGDRWYLWGVFSVGDRATSTGKYDYFSKITHFVPWIKSIINHS